MKQDQLYERLNAYTAWREKLIETIEGFRSWLEYHELATSEQEFRIFETIEAYYQKHPDPGLRLVRLTLYDQATVDAFLQIYDASHTEP